ncbi:permease [Kangiella taiwanensis]|uniref:Permease n=1 Tax=Kangiella taiwanensis TaxID=1079179 RepID=A0ABP8I8K7_9GAMM|nr:permease [Kangiella taiwanensis]
MQEFLDTWNEAVVTSLGFFWMALWAFILGYLVSSLIQVLITRERMQKAMGEDGPRSMFLGTFFGFISSSCSFSALSTTRTIFNKGAGLAPSLAFLLASTNLVIELGMVIAIFLGWQFVVGEYVGGLLLILVTWLLIRITRPKRLEAQAREHQQGNAEQSENNSQNWKQKLTSYRSWQSIGKNYVMEWRMVWRDVLIGFTVAGVISAMVPSSFFQALFVGSGGNADLDFGSVLLQTLVAPLAAFFTFIGSMGNIPLAAVLFGQGVTFAAVMAFIFSDLVVLPVLRINAKYYGWKMALYILILMLIAITVSALVMHYVLAFLGLLPDFKATVPPGDREFFKLNYQSILNGIFLTINLGLFWLWHRSNKESHDKNNDQEQKQKKKSLIDKVMSFLVVFAIIWLAGGLLAGVVEATQ